MGKKYFVHETSILDSGALVGDDTKIWHWSHIRETARIGKKCNIGQNVYVGNAIIGDNVKIQNNVSVYDGLVIEDNVFIGPSVVFTNVKNPRAEIDQRKDYSKTLIKAGSTIGANSTIVCGITLNEYCFIAAGAVVTKDVESFALMSGIPAKKIGSVDKNGYRV